MLSPRLPGRSKSFRPALPKGAVGALVKAELLPQIVELLGSDDIVVRVSRLQAGTRPEGIVVEDVGSWGVRTSVVGK